MQADTIFVIGPQTTGENASGSNKLDKLIAERERLDRKHQKWHIYADHGYVVPFHVRANTCLLMTGSFQRELVRYTVRQDRIEAASSPDCPPGIEDESYPLARNAWGAGAVQ